MHSGMLEHAAAAVRPQFSPAEVLTSVGGGKIKIRFLDDPAEREFCATLALGSGELPRCGQQVLIAGTDSESLYAIGIISNVQTVAPVAKRPLPGGGYAEIPEADTDACVKIFSPENELVLEYNSQTRQTRMHVDTGGLELLAANSDIVFRSGKQIRLEADSVAIQARRAADIGIIHAIRGVLSQFRLRSESAELTSSQVNVATDTFNIAAEETAIRGSALTGELENIKIKSNRTELASQTFITHCKNVYQTVEELCQLCSGRLRMIIQSTWHSRSQNTYLSTKEDFKVKADQIHLG